MVAVRGALGARGRLLYQVVVEDVVVVVVAVVVMVVVEVVVEDVLVVEKEEVLAVFHLDLQEVHRLHPLSPRGGRVLRRLGL